MWFVATLPPGCMAGDHMAGALTCPAHTGRAECVSAPRRNGPPRDLASLHRPPHRRAKERHGQHPTTSRPPGGRRVRPHRPGGVGRAAPRGRGEPERRPGRQIDGYFPDTSTINTDHGWSHDAEFVIRLPERWNAGVRRRLRRRRAPAVGAPGGDADRADREDHPAAGHAARHAAADHAGLRRLRGDGHGAGARRAAPVLPGRGRQPRRLAVRRVPGVAAADPAVLPERFAALEGWPAGRRPPPSATLPRPASGDLANECSLRG
jgi:hypothetical protein